MRDRRAIEQAWKATNMNFTETRMGPKGWTDLPRIHSSAFVDPTARSFSELTSRITLTQAVNRRNGETVRVPLTCLLDADEEFWVCKAVGVLERLAMAFLEATTA